MILLARIQKKIKKNIQSQSKSQETSKPKEKKRTGKDYLLIAVISFTLMVTIADWETLTPLNRALYVMLLSSLSLTYVRRQYNLSEKMENWVDKASIVSMGFALALFVVVMYYQIFA